MGKHRTNHRRMINHVPHQRLQRLITRTCPIKSDVEIVLFGCIRRLETGEFADGSRCRRVVDGIGLPPGTTKSNTPALCRRIRTSHACCHAQPLPAEACRRSRGRLLLGGSSAPSANFLTSNSVWTRRRAMTDEERDGGRRRSRALYTEAYKRGRRRHGWGWVVLMTGVVIGSTHVITHLGQLRFLPSTGW